MNVFRKVQAGLSLVEVLVAVIVFAIGLLAIAALQGKLVRGGADAKARTVAANLAEQRLEQFRSFTSGSAYGDIAAVAEASASTETVSGVNYKVWWDVDEYYFPAGGGAAVLGTTPSGSSDFKMVRIHVDWTEPTGADQETLLEDIISNSPPSGTLLTVRGTLSQPGPSVRYKSLQFTQAPQIIQVNLGDDFSRQTSRPEPEVEGEGPNIVSRFDAVTFTNQEGSDPLGTVSRREEFLNINCRCTELGATDPDVDSPTQFGLTPASWNGYEWKPGERVPGKRIGAPVTGLDQPFACDRCCRDHHDATDQPSYDPFRPIGDDANGNPFHPSGLGGDHGHFMLGTDAMAGQLVPADADGSEYLEACSLVRVNGVYQVTTDFNLESLVVLPIEYLESPTGLANYEAFAAKFVEDYVDQLTDAYPQQRPTLLADLRADPSTAPSDLQALWNAFPDSVPPPAADDPLGQKFLARGIYINFMNDEVRARIACRQGTGAGCSDLFPEESSGEVLPLVPFQEINVTRLANWGVDEAGSTSIFVTNDALTRQNAATYDRARALHCTPYAPTDGSAALVTPDLPCESNNAEVTASIQRSNTGLLVNANPIDTDDSTLLKDSIVVDFGQASPAPARSVKGTFAIAGSVQGVEVSNISVAGSAGIFCTRPEPSNYTCVFETGVDSGTVTVGNYNSVQRSGEVNNYVACPTGVILDDGTTTVTGLPPVNDGTPTETTTFSFTALPDEPYQLNIQIRKNRC